MSGATEETRDGTLELPSARTADDGARGSSPSIDRAAALAAGAPGIPIKFVYWVLGLALVASLGGLVGEHLFSTAGLNPVPTTVPRPAATTVPPIAPVPTVQDRPVDASLQAFMGLSEPALRPAPSFSLNDQSGQPTTIPAAPPKVVVLTFFNAPCNDICPVLAAEIERADADLGAQAAEVEFLTVNTDPAATDTAASAALRQTGLSTLPNWRMVTGPLAALNSVWKSYGVSISVDKKSGLEAHNDLIDFIDARGDLRYRATPFADESSTGAYSLPAQTTARWGQGIASYAGRLIADG